MSLTLKDGFGRALATIGDGSALIEGIKKSINGVSHALVTAEIKKDEKGKPSGQVATGYVEESELEQLTQETVSIPANFAGLEAAMVPTRLRDQLFEITEVVESEEYVEVTALHIFYRQRENSTTWTPSKTTKYSCAAICRNVMNNVVLTLALIWRRTARISSGGRSSTMPGKTSRSVSWTRRAGSVKSSGCQ